MIPASYREAREAAKHAEMHRIAPTIENLLVQNVSNVNQEIPVYFKIYFSLIAPRKKVQYGGKTWVWKSKKVDFILPFLLIPVL